MQIHAEVEDRYGRIPHSVENLFAYGRLRKLAEHMAIISIDKVGDAVAIKLGEHARVDPEKLMAFLADHSTASFSPSGILRIPIETASPIDSAFKCLSDIGL
jgi:transcription-repair coupling factor (superfamily II helicase)